MTFLKSRVERGPRRVLFAWGVERGTPIATSDPQVLPCLKSRAQRIMPGRVLEVLQ